MLEKGMVVDDALMRGRDLGAENRQLAIARERRA